MNANEFSRLWEEELDRLKSDLPVFVKNMEHLSKRHDEFKDKKYIDWIETWIDWSELSSMKKIHNSYDPFDNVDDEKDWIFLT